MLDNILNSVRRQAERVQRRGEEVAHATRLRMEVFQLNRELDGLYARLGRSYHAGAEVDVLQGVREDIRRVEQEISARERLITELGGDATDEETANIKAAPSPIASQAASGATAVTTQEAHAQGAEPNVPAAVPHPGQEVSPVTGDTASMGNEAGRDAQRHDNTLGQAEVMKGYNDPLNK